MIEELPQNIQYDYRLGYVRAGTSLSGFNVYGENADSKKIVLLGGCTTFEQAENGLSWGQRLYNLLEGKYQIYNGCTNGYTSVQCLLMLIRDGLLLKPDAVICVSGYYDFAYQLGLFGNEHEKEILKKYPATTLNHVKLYETFAARMGLGQEIYFGVENSLPAHGRWVDNMILMNALCEEYSIKFFCVLQPFGERISDVLKSYYSKVIEVARDVAFIHTIPPDSNNERIAKFLEELIWMS